MAGKVVVYHICVVSLSEHQSANLVGVMTSSSAVQHLKLGRGSGLGSGLHDLLLTGSNGQHMASQNGLA